MNGALFTLTCSLFVGNLLFAETSSGAMDMQSLLNDVSSIATQKSINIDYMPSVVTVIGAQTFLDAGVQNIAEALDMLPGFQEQVSQSGYTISTVRGFKNPNADISDKVKILVDGVAINSEVTGTASFYLDFPLQLVEKIEVLRGPASTMYGGGAYYGAVNIITKLGNSKKENQIYVAGGSYGAITAGTNISTTANGWDIFADGYVYSNDKSLYFNAANPSDNGYSKEATKDYSVGFKATKNNWEFLTRLKHKTSENYYGVNGTLNPLPDSPENHSDVYLLSQLKYKTNFGEYKSQTKLNYSHYQQSLNANVDGIVSADSNVSSKYYTIQINGFYSIQNFTEDNYGFETTLNLPEIASNDILLGAGINYDVVTQDSYYSSVENAIVQTGSATMEQLKNSSNFNYNNVNEPGFWTNPTATTLLPQGISRTTAYGYIQDLISINDQTDLILSLRLDDYSDFGAELSKRAGIVYRANDKTTLKLLYGSAYRAPTLTEAYALGHINLRMGEPNLKPEECNTYEAVMVYMPNFYNKFILNFYYTRLHNVIDLEDIYSTPQGYINNTRDRESKGVEFEYFYKANLKHNFYFNASYTNSDYQTPPDEDGGVIQPPLITSMPDISKFMAKAIYIYKPTEKLSFGTTWKYFSQTTQTMIPWVVSDINNRDYQSVVPAVHIFDETLTYKISPQSNIRLSIKNIFNATVLQPAFYYYSAKDGIQREGRNYMFTYTQKF